LASKEESQVTKEIGESTTRIQLDIVKGSLGGETSVLRTFRMSGKELVKERVRKERVRQKKSSSKKELVKETVSQGKS